MKPDVELSRLMEGTVKRSKVEPPAVRAATGQTVTPQERLQELEDLGTEGAAAAIRWRFRELLGQAFRIGRDEGYKEGYEKGYDAADALHKETIHPVDRTLIDGDDDEL